MRLGGSHRWYFSQLVHHKTTDLRPIQVMATILAGGHRGLRVMEPTSELEFEWSYDDYDEADEAPEGSAEDGEDDGDSR